MLGRQADYTVARRLVEIFAHQFDSGWCKMPLKTSMPTFNLDGNDIFISDPKNITLPREGRLKVIFPQTF